MIFAKLSRIAAYLCLIFGSSQVVLGLIGGSTANYEAFARRYLGTETTGEAIDRGLLAIGLAIVFGAIWEICSHLKQINDKST
ncbi:hypothetical protein GCM10007094_41220 [Pseudovibrio japonicus]|uniref:Uncharacterized protein n=1 Tax=Pseudovibrio japonicus TaxID=366534 RepID=A0ABQ3END7_9HYPH|nr:hypothetical protein [Pseudovibrio japonicus]GHB47690.1 hypothetical protein GCM10007094_41220 [Pseudovibrio japonicus]